jgi:penicillin-binding protein 2
MLKVPESSGSFTSVVNTRFVRMRALPPVDLYKVSMTLLFKRPKTPKPPPKFDFAGLYQPTPIRKKHKALVLLGAMISLLLGAIGGRLFYLQLVNGAHWRQRADDNRIRLIARQPERGRILDRKGRILVGSKLSHSVFLWPVAQKDAAAWEPMLKKLAKILQKPEAELRQKLEIAGYNSTDRVRVARRITPAQATAIGEAGIRLNGVEVDAETTRVYKYGNLAAHILGYTGELSREEYDRLKSKGYRIGDVNGKLGIEASREQDLRGEWGGQQVEVDVAGKVLRILGEKPIHMGKDVQLTIDAELQKSVEQAIGNTKGAIVVLDPNDGAVLAMTSRPTFNPNMFSQERITPAEWAAVQKQDHAFVNRAVQAFQPASTFKIVTTTAAIESGKWPANTVLNTFPSLTFGGTTFGEWNGAGFGPLGFAGAITHSSDTFFYQIAQRIDGEPFTHWMHRYGVGQPTGIELLEEAPGILPDATWKQQEIKEGWLLGDSINMTIGQGFLSTTPLQVAAMFAVPANGGYRVKPHLIRNDKARQARESLNLRPETLEVLRAGLRGVVTEGTGQEVLDVGYLPPIAGKSGTSEDLGQGSDTWFAAYAPAEKPEIVVVVFAERSGSSGGKVGAPMVREVMEAYFAQKALVKSKP